MRVGRQALALEMASRQFQPVALPSGGPWWHRLEDTTSLVEVQPAAQPHRQNSSLSGSRCRVAGAALERQPARRQRCRRCCWQRLATAQFQSQALATHPLRVERGLAVSMTTMMRKELATDQHMWSHVCTEFWTRQHRRRSASLQTLRLRTLAPPCPLSGPTGAAAQASARCGGETAPTPPSAGRGRRWQHYWSRQPAHAALAWGRHRSQRRALRE